MHHVTNVLCIRVNCIDKSWRQRLARKHLHVQRHSWISGSICCTAKKWEMIFSLLSTLHVACSLTVVHLTAVHTIYPTWLFQHGSWSGLKHLKQPAWIVSMKLTENAIWCHSSDLTFQSGTLLCVCVMLTVSCVTMPKRQGWTNTGRGQHARQLPRWHCSKLEAKGNLFHWESVQQCSEVAV